MGYACFKSFTNISRKKSFWKFTFYTFTTVGPDTLLFYNYKKKIKKIVEEDMKHFLFTLPQLLDLTHFFYNYKKKRNTMWRKTWSTFFSCLPVPVWLYLAGEKWYYIHNTFLILFEGHNFIRLMLSVFQEKIYIYRINDNMNGKIVAKKLFLFVLNKCGCSSEN